MLTSATQESDPRRPEARRPGARHGTERADFGVSEDTVRRDLRELAAEGLLQRVHGGALPASPAVAPFRAARGNRIGRRNARIARTAAEMIAPGQVVIVDGGTTAVQLARSTAARTCARRSSRIARASRLRTGRIIASVEVVADRRQALQAFDRDGGRGRRRSAVAHPCRYLFHGRDRRASDAPDSPPAISRKRTSSARSRRARRKPSCSRRRRSSMRRRLTRSAASSSRRRSSSRKQPTRG